MRKNKLRISERLKRKCVYQKQRPFDACQITLESISELKKLSQRCHQTRLARQDRMKPRQLKKLRKKQRILGLVGSKFGGICKTKLRVGVIFQSACNLPFAS